MTTARLGITLPAIVGPKPYAPQLQDALERLDDVMEFPLRRPASGSAPGKDKAAVQAAHNAAIAGGTGGVVRLGDGVYDIGDFKPALPVHPNPAVHIAGRGQESTILKATTDAGLDTFFLAPSGAGLCFSTIADLTLRGWDRPALGVAPAAMNGLKMVHGMVAVNVDVQGFYGGVVQAGDHTTCVGVRSTNNYYNLLAGYQTTFGDHIYVCCRFDGALKASFGIRADGSMQSSRFYGGHGGFSPYGAFIEPRAVDATYALGQVTFDGFSWEALGHAYIWSADDNARLKAIQHRGSSVSMHPDYKIAGEPDRPLVKVAEIDEWHATNTPFWPTTPISTTVLCTDALFKVARVYGHFVIHNFLQTWNRKGALDLMNGLATTAEGVEFFDAGFRAVGGQIHPAAIAVAAGELAQWSALTYVVPHGYAAAPSLPAGVAMNGSAAPVAVLIVLAKESTGQVEVLTADADWSTVGLITTDPANAGKVTAAADHAALAGRPLLGRPWFGGAVAGGKQAVRLAIP